MFVCMERNTLTDISPLHLNQIIQSALFSEPMRVETVRAAGQGTWLVGRVGTQTERFRSVTLTDRDIAALTILDTISTFEGDEQLLRLGLQAYALGIAYEFDPYFGLSISRVDPLPHQLAAVYDHLLKLARVRFLLADDAGAGKTIMAGLLLRELKLRGLVAQVAKHVEPSLTELPQKAEEEIGRASEEIERGVQGAEGRLAQAEARHTDQTIHYLYVSCFAFGHGLDCPCQ